MKFGYIRESIDEDNIDFQIDAIEKYGVDEIHVEYVYGERQENTRLDDLIKKLRAKDVLVVYELDRLGKTIKGLQELAEYFSSNNINLVVLKDNIDTTTNIGKYFLYWMCVLGDMERNVLQEATKIGVELAKIKGREGGRPGVKDKDKKEIIKLYKENHSVEEISKKTGWAISTIYKYIREDKAKDWLIYIRGDEDERR